MGHSKHFLVCLTFACGYVLYLLFNFRSQSEQPLQDDARHNNTPTFITFELSTAPPDLLSFLSHHLIIILAQLGLLCLLLW